MPNQQNKELVSKLNEKVSKAKSIVFVEYKGLTSNQANELRKKIATNGAEIEVAKNTLLKIALTENGYNVEDQEKVFEGTTATIISYEDAIAPIKTLYENVKAMPALKIKAGAMDGAFYNASQVETLSKIPSREVLIAQVLSGFNSPITGFVNVLSGTKRNFVYALAEIAKKK